MIISELIKKWWFWLIILIIISITLFYPFTCIPGNCYPKGAECYSVCHSLLQKWIGFYPVP